MDEIRERHDREIMQIIHDHNSRAQNLDGHELQAVRRACSQAIADACIRQRQELSLVPHGEDEPLVGDKEVPDLDQVFPEDKDAANRDEADGSKSN
jgi:hypothetical protein